ncbi:hypothetical protein HY837_06015 [archaeon]|nr:hypothetical protein [archaeon]
MAEIENYLEELEEQKVQEEKKIVVVSNPTLDLLLDEYDEWLKDRVKGIDTYQKFYTIFRDLKYTVNDVRDFSFMLQEYREKQDYLSFVHSGFFLSALINASKAKNFEIITRHLNRIIYFIGFDSDKNILVNGNVGFHTGLKKRAGTLVIKGDTEGFTGNEMMYGGRIIVHGNVTGNTGSSLWGGEIIVNGNATGRDTGMGMRSGKIIIKGNAGDQVGNNMVSGKIFIKGNTGYRTGLDMFGGEIHVEGEIGSIDKTCRGKIYHKGELVWPE